MFAVPGGADRIAVLPDPAKPAFLDIVRAEHGLTFAKKVGRLGIHQVVKGRFYDPERRDRDTFYNPLLQPVPTRYGRGIRFQQNRPTRKLASSGR